MNSPTKGRPLVINNLSKSYDEVHALKQLNFELNQGEIFGLLGPNGAGKTTLISILTSLLNPTSGTASIFGHDILTDSLNARKLVGMVPQEIVSHGYFSVNQVLHFHSGYYGLNQNKERIDFLLEKLALTEQKNKLVAQLSGGMKRRLLIAKALVHSPPLLLLDEPTAGVDVELRNKLWKFVRELHQEGMTILLTTHYLQEAEELCDRIGVLNDGELIELNNTQKLIRELTHREVRLTLTQTWKAKKTSSKIKINDNQIEANIGYHETVGELIKELGIPLELIKDIKISEGSLEDAFVSLLNRNKE